MGYGIMGRAAIFCLAAALAACGDNNNNHKNVAQPVPADAESVYAVANGCFAIGAGDGFIAASSQSAYTFRAVEPEAASHFLLRPADLGTYLLLDVQQRYLTSDGEMLQRQSSLRHDTNRVDGEVVIQDRMQSEGEWQLTAVPDGMFNLQHLASGNYIAADGTLTDAAGAAGIALLEQTDCADFPELSVDATGEIAVTEFDDGSVFGFVETHSHLFSNFAFGGGGVYHGAPFHRLGVEHALEDCDLVHGEEGRRDLLGFAFGASGDFDLAELLPALITGELPDKNHDTEGYPDFTSWPDAHLSSTHQVQYYKWLERAWLGGLRLLVQHATTNQVLCQLVVGVGAQTRRYDCNDMVAVDRIIEETYALERYIDALAGGPGKGWFRIVYSPAEARQQIKDGRLAVVLGIETSDLFDCFLVPFGEFGKCTEQDVIAKLDRYHEMGVRVLFPVHKFDNAFSAGDGDRRVSDIGNFSHTGHYTNFIECPEDLLTFPGGFDRGGVALANLNQPRDVFDSKPPFDMSGFESDPVGTLLARFSLFGGGSLEGEYCQNHGLTELGEFLITQMMQRGMVIEVDHLPRKSYRRAYELLVENDYPAVGSHGRNNNGLLYALGGVSKTNFGRCRSADTPATMDDGFQSRIALMREQGAYAAEGFGFDLNGFAGAPGPRFGANSVCSEPQTDEGITYPFRSYAGDVTFEQPVVGNRVLDFNTEGLVHLGLVAELIEDVRRDGVSDEELEPLFRSAEGYLRMWEKSEARGAALKNRL
ncbi:MAG: membrane dipeptidase [Pseudomonadales bacterium]|nr:membrane dipeptidase [Halioglobus sp.]MCP5131343.1 membrane dipeptidase [Pseudomonadales bacterium]